MMRDATPSRLDRPPYGAVLATAAVALVVVVVLSAAAGAVRIGFWETLTTMLSWLGLPVTPRADPTEVRILTALRLPRVVAGVLVGALLGLAGALLQGALRNGLAEPVTTGGAAGGLLGASLTLVLAPAGFVVSGATAATGPLLLRLALAVAGAFVVTWGVLLATRTGARVLPAPLLLGGLAANAFVGALAALLLFLGASGVQTAATVVVGWIFGGLLQDIVPGTLPMLFLVLAATALGSAFLVRELDLVLSGEEEAAVAGVRVGRMRLAAVALASLATGVAVATAGVLAFVGLVAPAAARPFTGPGHARMMPVAAVAGAILLPAVDAAGRVLAAPAELPAGIVTAAVGAPVLILLLRRTVWGVRA